MVSLDQTLFLILLEAFCFYIQQKPTPIVQTTQKFLNEKHTLILSNALTLFVQNPDSNIPRQLNDLQLRVQYDNKSPQKKTPKK